MRQEVNYLSERQEIFRGMVEHKFRVQSRATEKNYEQIFEEMKELEEKKPEEALPNCAFKITIYGNTRTIEMKQEGCRDLQAPEG